MKLQDVYEQKGNTSIAGVLTTIRDIYLGRRSKTSPKLCHVHTASNIDPAHPADQIMLFGYGEMVVHSAISRSGELVDKYAGVSSSKLLPSGNLQINVRGSIDELEYVYGISVGDFLSSINQ